MKSCCFASVIFEGNLPFFPEFLVSLQTQTDLDFTLLLFNDGVANLEEYLIAYTLPHTIIDASGTIAEVRQQMLEYIAASQFEHTIFGDTDDFFAPNRVSVSKALLNEHLVIAQDVWLVDEGGLLLQEGYWSQRAEILEDISYENLKYYNVLGLGNTAICNHILPKELYLPSDLIAVDWYVFSCLLKGGLKAFFTAKTHIYYRQYEGNTIGLKRLTLQRFKREVAVKLQHYRAMAKIDTNLKALAFGFEEIDKELENISEAQISPYIKEQEQPFWWEQIQL